MDIRSARIGLLILITGFQTGLASASNEPSIAAAIDYLADQQQMDGRIHAESDIATPEQATHEALESLALLGQLDQIDTNAAIHIPSDPAMVATEYLVRITESRLRVQDEFSPELMSILRERQNTDGSFGAYPAYTGTTRATAQVLALLADTETHQIDVSAAIQQLLTVQQPSGAWQSHGADSVIDTALALKALWTFRHQYPLGSPIESARQWLLAQHDAAGVWSSPESSALVFGILARTSTDRSVLESTSESLLELQLPDGRWGQGVYETALVLQGLHYMQTPPADRITVSGEVLDADSNLPLADARATLSGPLTMESVVNDEGFFDFSFFEDGEYRLDVSAPDYSTLTYHLTLRPGDERDLGTVMLARGAVSPETVTLTGTVRDKQTNQPVAGATISVQPEGLETLTDAEGRYEIPNLQPQEIDVSVTAEGYLSAEASLSAQAGQVINLSPLLVPVSSQMASITGTVTDTVTGELLEGARALLTLPDGDQEMFTDGSGAFSFSSLDPVPAMLRIEKDGYYPQTANWEMAGGTHYDMPTALVPVGEEEPETPETSIQGVVINSATGASLNGTRIDAYSETLERTSRVYTDADGRFTVNDLHGEMRFTFVRGGFHSQTLEAEIPEGAGADLGQIEMQVSNIGESAVRGRVFDGTTDSTLIGAQVRIRYGQTTRTIYTNHLGEFYRPYIPADDIELNISYSGYDSRKVYSTTTAGEILDIGDVYLRPADEQDARPDLVVRQIDRSDVANDPYTLELSGTVTAQVRNDGHGVAQGEVNAVAFHDRNANGDIDADEQVLDIERLDVALAPGESLPLEMTVAGVAAFRDMPISILVDADNEIPEALERNNVAGTVGRCAGGGGGLMDLAMCLDTSGSVSGSDFVLQTAGTAAAIADPDIIPHHGRVRLTVFKFNGGTHLELPPTIITAENAEEVAGIVENIRYAGGGTAIHSCVNVATDQLLATSPASNYQVIDVSTDGGSSYSLALNASARAQELGIDAINALAVGPGAAINLLEDMVFPQPAGDDSGFVIEITSYQDYADAIATKVRRETRMADLTVGKPALTDDGSQVSVTARIGNAGNRVTPDDVRVVVYHVDPDAGGVEIGSATLPALGESDYLDVDMALDYVPPYGDTLVIVIDPEDAAAECSQSNNRIELLVTGVRGELSIAPSAAVYPAQALAEFTATLHNTGSVAGDFAVRAWIEDLAGTQVADLGSSDAQLLESDAQGEVVFEWPTGETVAGTYRVRGELQDASGMVLAEAGALFELQHDAGTVPLVNLRVTPDKSSYHTTDTVALQVLAQNRSINTIIVSAGLRLSLLREDGSLLSQAVQSLSDLAPGAVRERVSNHDWAGELPGEIHVVAELVDGSNMVMATVNAVLPVAESLALTLGGTVSALEPAIARGEPQQCAWDVVYEGMQAEQEVPVRISAVSLEDETVLYQHEQQLALTSGIPHEAQQRLETRDYTEGMAACVLEAQVDGVWQPLDNAVFRIDPPPIELGAAMGAGERGRLLVLLDPGCESTAEAGNECNADPYGPGDAPPLDIQRAHLESVLTEAGWRYTITEDVQTFEQAFRSEAYAVFALFNEQLKLPESLQRAIVDDIEAGRGLLVAGNHDRRNGRLEDALGIKSLGKNLDVDMFIVEAFGDYLGADLELAVLQRPNALRLEGADVLGEYRLPPKGNKQPETVPAFTRHEHGNGIGVYAGFDWPVQSAMQGDDGEFAGLLAATLDVAHPQPYLPVAGRVFPLRISVQNVGIAVPGEVHLNLPVGTELFEGPADAIIDDGVIHWPFELAEDAQKTFIVWLRLPVVPGPVEFEAVIYAGIDDELEEQARTNVMLEVLPEQ